ncbi:hypothetical protein MKW92_003447 [Papaver armeniacum]|nr:hypothetical protein MKW92_003447 [Papaver armeniacum]
MSNIVVLDNGAGLCKAGIAGERDPSVIVPNCLGRPIASKKWLIADQLHTCEDLTSVSIRRPFDRGYLINPDLQKEIWERIFRSLLHIDPTHSTLLLVEPLFNLPSIQRSIDEIVFEDFGFQSLGDELLGKGQCSLVVDCGFSFTHAAPVLQNFTINHGVKRLDLGGKALTNYLKELVSYRSINVMDETFIMDDVKEKLCFVSLDVPRDLQIARSRGKDNLFRSSYVLPDGIEHMKGFVKDPDQAKRYLTLEDGLPLETNEDMNRPLSNKEKAEERKKVDLTKNEFDLTNERFLVPEMIFQPADLAVNSCHPHLHPVLYESIILTGGSTLFPRFAQRLERDLRHLIPDNYQVKITTQEDPILGVWRGGSLLASSPDFESTCVTKSEYEEYGSARCRRRFFH